EPMDEGWTRYVFDVHHVKFTPITEKDLAAGGLRARFDAIGFSDGSGNLGANAAPIDSFVNAGGTVLAFNNTSMAIAQALSLPVRNVVGGAGGRGGRGAAASSDFYCPGSILSVVPNASSSIGRAMTAPVP